jgi:hypothetical protein
MEKNNGTQMIWIKWLVKDFVSYCVNQLYSIKCIFVNYPFKSVQTSVIRVSILKGR